MMFVINQKSTAAVSWVAGRNVMSGAVSPDVGLSRLAARPILSAELKIMCIYRQWGFVRMSVRGSPI